MVESHGNLFHNFTFLLSIILFFPIIQGVTIGIDDEYQRDKDIQNLLASSIHYVSKSGSTHQTISSALRNSSGGDTIIVANGTYLDKDILIPLHLARSQR